MMVLWLCGLASAQPVTPVDGRLELSATPAIAIIVTDLGYYENNTRMAMDLPEAVALGWAPEGRLTRALAPIAHHRGHLNLGQLYMRGHDDPDYSITTDMTQGEIQNRLEKVLARVPFAQGLLPIQASVFSTDVSAVHRFVLAAWKHRPLMLVDTFIASNSQIYPVALQYQLSTTRRDAFLDTADPTDLENGWNRISETATSKGVVVVLVPAEPLYLRFLAVKLRFLSEYGLRLVPLSVAAELQARESSSGVIPVPQVPVQAAAATITEEPN